MSARLPFLPAFGLALLLVATTFATLRLAQTAGAAPESASPAVQEISPCVLTGTKRAAPEQVLLGEEVRITMTVGAACPSPPVHWVLVLDGSDAMSGNAQRDVQRAGQDLVRGLNLDDHPERQIGVVVYNDEPNSVCQLTNRESIALRCLDRLTSTGSRDIGAAIEEGRRVLVRGRPGRPDAREIMLVLSAGEDAQGCSNVSANAGQTKSQNVLLAMVCLGQDCDTQCFSQAASNRRYFHQVDQSGQLRQTFQEVANEASPASADVESAALVDPLGAKVGLVAGSAMPPATLPGPNGRRPTWQFGTVPESGITVTLLVTPTGAGFVTTNAGATWTITDSEGLTATMRLPDPRILVLRPAPPPSATPTAASGSATATSSAPTAPPTISATPQSPPTATFTPPPTRGTPSGPSPTATPTPTPTGGVTGEPPSATPTPAEGTEPATAQPTSIPTGDGGATSTPTPSSGTPDDPAPEAIYLPVLSQGAFLGGDPDTGGGGSRLDTMIAFERHASTTTDPLGTQRAIRQLAQGLLFPVDELPRRIGLVSFGGVAVTCPLGSDIDVFDACVGRALASGPAVGGNLAAGLDAARAALDAAADGRDGAQAVVAIAVLERPAGCDAALVARDALSAQGARLITLCPGDGCERTCLRDVASGRADYIVMQSFAWLLPTLNGVLDRLMPMGMP